MIHKAATKTAEKKIGSIEQIPTFEEKNNSLVRNNLDSTR